MMIFAGVSLASGGVQQWSLAKAALVNLLTISNQLATMVTRDRDGSHSHVCGRGGTALSDEVRFDGRILISYQEILICY